MDSASPTTTSWVSFTYLPPYLLPALVWLQTSRSPGQGMLLGTLDPEPQAPTGHTGAGNWGGSGYPA